jgi:transposase-like protein
MRCIKTRGKKGVPHRDPADPPRRRGNKVRGHGTWDNDRPPVVGTFGRETGQVRLEVCASNRIIDLQPHVDDFCAPKATVNTDEWQGYNRVADSGRSRVSVCHTPGARVWAKDLDGDGVREVHVNTAEGFWTGLRNFLRPFRGVNKVYLQQYVIMHEWAHHLKTVTLDFLRILCGVGTTQLTT